MPYDRTLLGHVVDREITRRYGRVSIFLREVPNLPTRRTIERVARGDPAVKHRTIQRLEGALGMPRDFLLGAVAMHDSDAITSARVDPDLRRWLLAQIGDTNR